MDGVVSRMAEPQNLSRAAAFLAEGLIFLSWISEQSAGYKGLVTQLTDRLLWDKVTVKDRLAVLAGFTVAAHSARARVSPVFLILLLPCCFLQVFVCVLAVFVS